MKLPSITDKQLQILLYLYKFSFLNTNQFQKLLNHSNIRTVQRWLHDLTTKKYIISHDFNHYSSVTNTKPAIYSLTKLARKRLKMEKNCDIDILNRIYQERKLCKQTMYQRVLLADIYLSLCSQLKENETLHFSTKPQLKQFDYFPEPLPDAYIAISNSDKTSKRYFLFLLTVYVPWRVLKQRLEQYVYYSEENTWSNVTDDTLPLFLCVCPSEKVKKQINEVMATNLPRALFYIATKDNIVSKGFRGDIWTKVE